jgi:hypothetical protein
MSRRRTITTQRSLADMMPIPFRGGCNTFNAVENLPSGSFSMVQNERNQHPGFMPRTGYTKLHATADNTNKVKSIYQFSKGRRIEKHLFAQMGDDDVLEATNAPPVVTYEVMTLDVSPATDWAAGDTITGQTSGKTCLCVAKLTATTYSVINRSGAFTLGEIVGVTGTAAKLADQGAANPTFAGGEFGTQVFSGTASSIPASWSNLNDLMIFSNGVDQHQIYAGTENFPFHFGTYSSASALPLIPVTGKDYTLQMIDGLATTTADLAALGTNATDCIIICCPVVPDRVKLTIGTKNTTASNAAVNYFNGSWTAVTALSDGTVSDATKTISGTGTMSWTQPTDAIANYMFGKSGFWLKITFSAALSAGTTVSACTYGAGFQPIQNVWDGTRQSVIESRFFDNSLGTYATYSYASIAIGGMVGSETVPDYLYFNSFDNIIAFYTDPTSVPSTTASTAISEVATWTGTAWTAVTNLVDGSSGFTKPGWTTFTKSTAAQKLQFQGANYYSYWFRVAITTGKTLSVSTVVSLYTMPAFDINDNFTVGQCSIAWKHRAVYASPTDQFLYVTAQNQPMVLNGSDFAVLEPGDGRSNKPVAMRLFKNELMVWQEERGPDGGCFTLFEGYTPETFGKLLLSAKLGALNNQSAEVVENIVVSEGQDVQVKTVVFVLSHYGVYMSDGMNCTFVSDDIRNYFDPHKTECIRRGYENEMYLFYDASEGILRLGLVSGGSATTCNIFPVYDLIDQKWTFDKYAKNMSYMAEVEAGSGDVSVLQVCGGVDDGRIYQMNNGTTDDGTAIDAYCTMEFDGGGLIINAREMSLIKDGSCTITPYAGGVAQTTHTVA